MIGSLIERIVDSLALVAAAWPAIRSWTSKPFWQAFAGFGRLLTVLIAIYVLFVVALSLWAPLWMLRLFAGGGVVWLLLERWHARVAHGKSWRWPPGSLRILPLGPWFDRGFFLEQSRRLGSPFKTNHFIRPMVCFVGLSDGLEFLKAHESSLGSPPMPFGRFIPGGFLRHMPLERHAATKQVFRKAIVREVYEPFEDAMRRTIRSELDRMALASGSDVQGVRPRSHIQRAVFAMWTRLFFGVSEDEAAFARLRALYKTIDIRNPSSASDAEIHSALEEIWSIVRPRANQITANGNEPRSLLDAVAASDPDVMEDPTVTRNFIYLFHTSWADVSGLLQWLFRMMTEHPEWAVRLRDVRREVSPNNADLPLSTRIVMETLRLEQSEQLYRVATHRIQHANFVIPRGWLVRLCVRESHQDPAVFTEPRTFNPDRFLQRTYSRREYAPFGGPLRHACLGEGLTTAVGRIFVEELTASFTWRTTSDGAYEYGPWRHWRPSSDWRVSLSARHD